MPNLETLIKNGIKEIKCTKCGKILPLSKFRASGKYINYCNGCDLIKMKLWRKQNPEKYRSQKIRHAAKHKEQIKQTSKLWKKNHPDNVKEHARRSYTKNKEKRIKKFYNRLRTDALFRIKNQLRTDTNKKLKKMFGNRSNKPHKLVGCSLPQLKQHLESKFKSGMTWENYGGKRYNKDGTARVCWEIDHIINMASAKTKEEMYSLCHYTNLQPLWWWENVEKSKNEIPNLRIK